MTLTLTRTTPLHMPSRQAITSRCLQGAEHQLSPFCPTMVCALLAGPTQEWQLPCCHEEGAWRRLAGPIRLEHTPIYVRRGRRRGPRPAHIPLLPHHRNLSPHTHNNTPSHPQHRGRLGQVKTVLSLGSCPASSCENICRRAAAAAIIHRTAWMVC